MSASEPQARNPEGREGRDGKYSRLLDPDCLHDWQAYRDNLSECYLCGKVAGCDGRDDLVTIRAIRHAGDESGE
jgi:hypothetical protein